MSPPVAALGGDGTSPLYPVRYSVGLISWHGGVPPCLATTRLSRRERGSCGARPLRQSYITPHCPQCPPVATLKLRLVPVTASRPSGEGNGPLCKIAFAGYGRTAVGASRSLARPTRRRLAPLWLLWRCGIGQALRAAFWSVACGQSSCVCPAHPVASPLRGIGLALGARPPPRGSLSPAQLCSLYRNRLCSWQHMQSGQAGLSARKPAWPPTCLCT